MRIPPRGTTICATDPNWSQVAAGLSALRCRNSYLPPCSPTACPSLARRSTVEASDESDVGDFLALCELGNAHGDAR